MTYFLDFDRTLFDTDAFIAHLLHRPDAHQFSHDSEETLGKILEDLARKGEVAFAPGELKPFVYPDVPEFLRSAGNEAVIVTYGNPTLQRLKVENSLAGIPRVSALYTGDVRKGHFLRDRASAYGASLVLVDDRSIELEILAAECPCIRLFEIRRDGNPGDGRWPVIRSLADLPSV